MKAASLYKNIITFDLEEWYHILDLPNKPESMVDARISSSTEKSLYRFLELLKRHEITCTFFVLGQIAEHNHKIITDMEAAGHEIASHGYNHDLITSLTPLQFSEDISRSKKLLEDITGKEIAGYRGPGFSITAKNLWALDMIAEAGYAYDATIYPGKHGHGGLPGLPIAPFLLNTLKGAEIEEYPVTLFGGSTRKLAFSGGGYFRFFPYMLISALYDRFNQSNIPVVSYFHARDFDPQVPRVAMPAHRRFKCYVNLKYTYSKLERLIQKVSFCSIRDWRKQNTILPSTSVNSSS